MQTPDKKWFLRTADGTSSGPFSTDELQLRSLSGDLTAEARVSTDKKSWTPVLQCAELSLDCVVLTPSESGFGVLGPFPKALLGRADVQVEFPEGGAFFVRDDGIPGLLRARELEAKLAKAEAEREEALRKAGEAEAAFAAHEKQNAEAASRAAEEREALVAELEKAKALAEARAEEAKAASRRAAAAEGDLTRMRAGLQSLMGGAVAAPVAVAEVLEPDEIEPAPMPRKAPASAAAAVEAQLQKELSMMAGRKGSGGLSEIFRKK